METLIKRYQELDVKTKETLSKIISDEFGHVSIVKKYDWATPDWVILIYSSGNISSMAQIIIRDVHFDKKRLKTGGLSNLITLNDYRGSGLAHEILSCFEKLIFEDLHCDLGLLLCADNLVPYYQKKGWFQIHSDLYFNQSTGKKKWGANVMLLSDKVAVEEPDTVDLNGLPW